MCLVVPYSKIVKYFLVSCIYPAIDGEKASSSRSVEGERQIERGKRPFWWKEIIRSGKVGKGQKFDALRTES